MYEKFYGLKEPPFNLTPDSRFLFLSNHHREALAALLYGVREQKGFTLLTGEIGSGKTMLCRALIHDLTEESTRVALVLDSYVSEVELLASILQELTGETPPTPLSRKALIDRLREYLVQQEALGRKVVLIVDEAQNLTDSVLEQVRLLGNLETETHKLLQIVLVGQPELQTALVGPKLEQLNQRIAVRYHLRPFEADEIEPYIRHRLQVAGGLMPVEFTPKAIDLLYEYTSGIPRKINLLCDRALLSGYVASTFRIDEAIIRAASVEVGADQWRDVTRLSSKGVVARRRLRWPSTATVVYTLTAAALLVLAPVFVREAKLLGLFLTNASSGETSAPGPVRTVQAAPPAPTAAPTPAPLPPAEFTSLAKPRPALPWSYDEDQIVRVDRPEEARTAAVLTVLAAWGIEVNLQDFRKLRPEDLQRFDVVAANTDLGLRSLEVDGALPRVQICDLPAILEIDDPEGRLGTYVVLLRILPNGACLVADPVRGLHVAPRETLNVWWRRARIIYFDADNYGALARGQQSETVRALQQDLANMGYYRGPLTGQFDRETVAAIELLQRYFQRFPTGQLDAETVMLITSHRQADRPRLTPRKEQGT